MSYKNLSMDKGEIDFNVFESQWIQSGVQGSFLQAVRDRIEAIVKNLHNYDPVYTLLDEYKASIEMLSFTGSLSNCVVSRKPTRF